MLPSVGHANTQIQIHKYTNTVWVKFADRPNMCYIFEKVMVRGPQKQCSRVFGGPWAKNLGAPSLSKSNHLKGCLGTRVTHVFGPRSVGALRETHFWTNVSWTPP